MDLFGLKKKKQELLEKESAVSQKEVSVSALLNDAQNLKQLLEERAIALAEEERRLQKQQSDLSSLRSKIEFECEHIVSERNQLEHDRCQLKEDAQAEVQKSMIDAIRHISEKPYLNGTPVFDDFQTVHNEGILDNSKLLAAFREPMKLHYPLSAKVNLTSASGSTYAVSLTACTCPDFQNRRQPCKHMYRLACELGLLINYSDKKINKIHAAAERTRLEQDRLEQKKVEFDRYKEEVQKGVPHLVFLWTDFEDYLDSQRIRKLEANRAKKSAETVRQIKQEKKKLIAENKTLWHQLRFLETQFPWIEDYKENALKPPAVIAALNDGLFPDEYTFLSQWITHDEFITSPEAQKYQRALDNYCRRERTEWSLGLDYERFIGYEYENKGWRVNYVGATEKKEDMGRDLIVRQGKNVKIIQCKRFSKAKNHIVRENVVFQLYGSAVLYGLQHPKAKVSAAIYTTSVLSDEARSCAKEMGIEVHEEYQLKTYPMVKCNIGADGEMRFHLPFSYHYDRIHITPSKDGKGDCYVYTVQEAMGKGFVKAKNWSGSFK